MHWIILLSCLFAYLGLLLGLGWITGRKNDEQGYYLGNRKSAWYLIAFGMIADSLSGVTFMSVPGMVGTNGFSYMQVVVGYFIGYQAISLILLPLYYRLNLTTIYSYLQTRFGSTAQRTGSMFFLLSRMVGAAGRLYLAVVVLQAFFLEALGVPLLGTAAAMMGMMWLYTWKGGIKTLIYTDALQAGMMLVAMGVAVFALAHRLDLGWSGWSEALAKGGATHWIVPNGMHAHFWAKDLIGGAFIAICMTGLDQNMMQKNLSCRNLRDAKKNMLGFSAIIVLVNFAFLVLGGLLYAYAQNQGIASEIPSGDRLFAWLSFNRLGLVVTVFFTLGLIASTLSSADSVLASLTTSFCIDILDYTKGEKFQEGERKRIRALVQAAMAIVLLLSIWAFEALGEQSVIDLILTLAGYTYGPLLGLFSFGLAFKHMNPSRLGIVLVALSAPVLSWLLESYLSNTFGFSFGIAILPLNGSLTFAGLWLTAWKKKARTYDSQVDEVFE